MFWCLLAFLSGAPAGAAAVAAGDQPTGFLFLPRLGVEMEYGGIYQRDHAVSSILKRKIEIDFFQLNRHTVYMEFDEIMWIGVPRDHWEYNQVRYRLRLGGWRYDLGDYFIGLFCDHWCYNLFYTEKYPETGTRSRGSFYTLALEFMSKGLRLGYKNWGINFDSAKPFEVLFKPHFGFWPGRLISGDVKHFDAQWAVKYQVRLDLLRYRRLIPYLETGGEFWGGKSWRLSPYLEGGLRLNLRPSLDLTPFVQYGRRQEYYLDAQDVLHRLGKNYLYSGLRLEYLLNTDTDWRQTAGDLHFLPEIHGQAGYAWYARNRFFGFQGNIEVDLELLRYHPWTIFLYTSVLGDTDRSSLALNKVTATLQTGLTYTWEPYFIEGFVQAGKRFDGHRYRELNERFNWAGMRLGTQGMKPGHFDDGISFSGPATYQWLNHWHGQFTAGHSFQNRDWQYLWSLEGKVRWDLLRWRLMVPYLQGEINWLAGGGNTPDAWNGAAEVGVRLHRTFDIAPYCRYQRRENAQHYRGPRDDQVLIGIKALF